MLCDKCKKNEASFYIEQIVNGERKALHLCSDCSKEAAMPINFTDVLQGFLYNLQPGQKPAEVEQLKCPECGLSYDGFKKTGKLGCARCYSTFAKELKSIFKNIQSNEEHTGKFPRKSGEELLKKRELENLKTALKKAVEKEEFEEAVALRDKIRAMEAPGGVA